MKKMLFVLTALALLISGCASKNELQKSPCACDPDRYYDRNLDDQTPQNVRRAS